MSDVDEAFDEFVDLDDYPTPRETFRAGAAWQRRQERREDDDVAVDQTWLKAIGFVREDHPNKWTLHRQDSVDLGLWKVDDGWKAMMLHAPNFASCIARQRNTRGQVRSLCAGLGIALDGRGEEGRT